MNAVKVSRDGGRVLPSTEGGSAGNSQVIEPSATGFVPEPVELDKFAAAAPDTMAVPEFG